MSVPQFQRHEPNFWLKIALGTFVLVSCIRAWMPLAIVEPAAGQIPDAGLQRKQTLEAIERTNAILVEIKQVLQSGPLNVRVVGADNPAGAPHGNGG